MFSIRAMCRVLEVSASGYYAWRRRVVSVRKRKDEQLQQRIRTIHLLSRQTYGAPRTSTPSMLAVPAELDVHIVLDNYGTHPTPLIHRWLAKRPRFHLHFTPTSASWMNLVERFFAALTEKQLRRGTHRSTIQLEPAIKNYLRLHNDAPRPFIWRKTADEILESVARFYKRTLDPRH